MAMHGSGGVHEGRRTGLLGVMGGHACIVSIGIVMDGLMGNEGCHAYERV